MSALPASTSILAAINYFFRSKDSLTEPQALTSNQIVGTLDRAVDLSSGSLYLDCKPDSPEIASKVICASQISITSSLQNVYKLLALPKQTVIATSSQDFKQIAVVIASHSGKTAETFMFRNIQELELIDCGNYVYAVYVNFDGDLFAKVFDVQTQKEVATVDLKTENARAI